MINLNDFYDFLEDKRFSIEEWVHKLENSPGDAENIRSIENFFSEIAYRAKEHEIIEVEEFSLAIGSISSLLTSNMFSFMSLLSDVILLSVDHLYDMTKNLIDPVKNYNQEQTRLIKESLLQLSRATTTTFQEYADNTLKALTSELLIADITEKNLHLSQIQLKTKNEADFVQKRADNAIKSAQDLVFFRTLIAELECRFPTMNKRGERILPIALSMNELANKPVDPLQLEAAIYVHDVGMAFIPDQILFKTENLIKVERQILERHPTIISDMLLRLSEWKDAADIVQQHHEKIDGSGYPAGLKSSQICDGAKILAILDAFDAMTHIRSDRPYKKTILRAVNEILKNTSQFDVTWVRIFIKVVKTHYID